MMLRSLVDEVVRRRLWPIPLVALIVAIAAPALFMKSAPADTAAPAAAPVATPGKVPASGRKLLETTDKGVLVVKRSTRKRQDPFAPPASAMKAKAAAATPDETSSAAAVPVAASGSTGSSGSTSAATTSPSSSSSTSSSNSSSSSSTSSSSSSSTKPKSSSSTSSSTPKSTRPKVTGPTTSSSASATRKTTYVDVRFGKQMGTMPRYRVPVLQTFQAGGRVAAMFVGYSAARNAAVFAIAPSTDVSGVTCRKVKGTCRFIDVAAGRHARLGLVGENGRLVSRRLDVVSIRHLPVAPTSKASRRMTSLSEAKCLLKRLQSLSATAPSIAADACA